MDVHLEDCSGCIFFDAGSPPIGGSLQIVLAVHLGLCRKYITHHNEPHLHTMINADITFHYPFIMG